MTTVDEVTAKVQRILQNRGLFVELRGGEFWVPYESTRCRVSVKKFGTDKTVVDLAAIVLGDVKVTGKLLEYIGQRSSDFIFGNLALLHIEGQKEGIVIFRHAILGDYLDEEELMTSLAAVVTTADQLDDELKAKFGGRRAID